MKQVLIKRGRAIVEDVPAPLIKDGEILVEAAYSLISAGTEAASVHSSGESLLRKAIYQPLNVLKVIELTKAHGISKTRSIIKGSLESGHPIGYSCSGIVVKVGKGIIDIKPGDRVACAGAGRANHAEVVLVPRNLCVKIPDECDISDASSVTLGAIAMQGVRRADAKLGECIAVIGLGLIGQITVQLLKIAGCRVMGTDIDNDRVELAKKLGMGRGIVSVKDALNLTNNQGVDSTIVTAASPSNEIIQQAMEMTGKKGKVVIVGDVGLGLKRSPFYEKEIDLLISCSYGPGRYDKQYEDKGIDYPYSYVRWTENRNMEEYLRLIAEGSFNFKALVDSVYSIDEAPKAYEELKGNRKRPLGILLKYPLEVGEAFLPVGREKLKTRVDLIPLKKDGKINVAIIGAGSFTRGVHLPNLQKLSSLYNISAIVSKRGSIAKETAKQFDAAYSSTDYADILNDKDIDMILIATRHNLHAKIAIEALKAGKAVFVEKPLALNKDELNKIKELITPNPPSPPFKTSPAPPSEGGDKGEVKGGLGGLLMVGFNRRFSPAAIKLKELISNRQNPIMINYRVNAGYIPLDNWVHTEEGGGRIIGEACHMFDFFNFLTDSEVESIDASAISPRTSNVSANDNFTTTIKYKDGSICTLIYTASGSRDLSKEYIEIYFDGKTITIDDFKELKVYGLKERGLSSGKADKGHVNELIAFEKFMRGKCEIPIPLWQIFQATEMSFIVDEMVRS